MRATVARATPRRQVGPAAQGAAPAGGTDDRAAWRAQRRGLFMAKADTPVPDARLRVLRRAPAGAEPPGEDDAIQAVSAAHRVPRAAVSAHACADQGTFHRVFAGGLVEAPSRHLVKMYRIADGTAGWHLEVERQVAHALGEAGAGHAVVTHVDCTRAQCRFDFALHEFVPGRRLAEFEDDEARMAAALPRLALALREAHRVRGRGFGLLDVAARRAAERPALSALHEDWHAFLLTRLPAHLDALRAAGVIDQDERQRMAALFAEAGPDLAGVEPALLHGDAGAHNVLLDARGAVVLLDWEDALLGDPQYDLAMWASFNPERRWQAFFDAYWGRAWRPGFRFWLYFTRIALAKTVHRLRFGVPERAGRPPAALRIARGLRGMTDTRRVAT